MYKKVGDTELHMHLFNPAGWKATDKRPCFVTIHGGGWTRGSPSSQYAFAKHCTDLGMVSVSVQYRFYKPGGPITVFDCVQDARSAMRYVRSHAAELGIDSNKIVTNGGSAGGHLATAGALFPGVDARRRNLRLPCAKCHDALLARH